MASHTLRSLPDVPQERRADDLFGRAALAERVAASILLNTGSNSIVYGVYGQWGEGKTSFLKFIEECLNQSPDSKVICFWFKPWQLRDEDALFRSFFETLADKLSHGATRRLKTIAKNVQAYGKTLRPVANLVPGYGPAFGASMDVVDSLSTISLDGLKKRIGNGLKESKKRITVFIDDIDRLDDDEIQALFKLLKVAADFDNATYVLALDPGIVSKSLAKRYSVSDDNAAGFLEKVVQVPISLPPAQEYDLWRFAKGSVNQILNESQIRLSVPQEAEFIEWFQAGLMPMVKTPRAVIRYANALRLTLPCLKGEVHPVDLMLIEGMRVFAPNLYERIRRSKSNLTQSQRRAGEAPGHNASGQELAGLLDVSLVPADLAKSTDRVLGHLFPLAQPSVMGLTAGPSERTLEVQQRAGAPSYFDRYFIYGIPSTDVPDEEIDDLMGRLANRLSAREAEDWLRPLMTEARVASLTYKLRRRSVDFTDDQRRNLAHALVDVSDSIPEQYNPSGAESRILIEYPLYLLPALVDSVADSGQRFEIAVRLVAETPLLFAAEWFQALRDVGDPQRPQSLTKQQTGDLAPILVKRIVRSAAEGPLWVTFRGTAPLILFIWANWGEKSEREMHIGKCLSQDARSAVSLITAYEHTKTDRTYRDIRELIDPALVVQALESVFGDQLLRPEPPRGDSDAERDLLSANRFIAYHNHVVSQRDTPSDAASLEDGTA